VHVLGISSYYHDSAAALLRDGQLIAAAEEERFSRSKHDYRFPRHAIQFCLQQGGIHKQDLDYVVFFEKPFRKFDRILSATLQTYPHSWKVFRESMISWMIDKLWVRTTLQNELGVGKDKILFSEHHLSHAASAFLCSPFEKAAILTVDGVGEWTTTTWGVGCGSEIRLSHRMDFPHSLGLLYSAFTAFLGFEVNEGEYKVMGMAAYGEPRYEDKVWKLVCQNCDGSFSLDMDYFEFHRSTDRTYGKKFIDLFGAPRPGSMLFFTKAMRFPAYYGSPPGNYNDLCDLNQHYADIAASVQRVTETLLLSMANHIHRETGLKYLCIAGGVGLNSLANSRILRETPFEQLFVQPAAGDGGGALGAALWAYNSLLGQPRQFTMKHAYWGRSNSDSEISNFLLSNAIPFQNFKSDEEMLDRLVERLLKREVIGWSQGRFEWGPRALGGRSILADPRNADMKDVVNTRIKFREPYRPFAPSVLAHHTEQYFDLPSALSHYPARYMLYVVPVRESQQQNVPAVVHIDKTARLQTVFEEQNPRYYSLIHRFGQATGVPVLLNTSLNLKGEPIVNTVSDAFQTFLASDMDALVLNNFIIDKRKCNASA
jgi:carbamoyltransferase